MAVLSPARMGGASAAAIAVATWCAAAAGGGAGVGGLDVPLTLLAAALAAGVVVAAKRGSTQVLPPGKDVVVLTAVTVAGFVGLYLAGWTNRQHEVEIARLLPLAVVGLSALWPEPNVLRYSLLLAAGTLLGTVGHPLGPRVAVLATLVAVSVALVTTNRLTAAAGRRLGGAAPAKGRRVAGEAAAVLVVVGLLAALASSLLPPPPGEGGGDGLGGSRRSALPGPAAPSLDAANRLDITAGRGRAQADDVVLLVDAAAADMWRTTTYDHWDGESLSRTPGGLNPLRDDTVRPGIGDLEGASAPDGAFQQVIVLARSAGVLAAAARPTSVSADDMTVRQGFDASLYPAGPLARGARYIAISDRTQAPGHVLRAIGDAAAAVPTDVADLYLQLPQVPAGVRGLTAEVAGNAHSTYERVRAVESWIRGHTASTPGAEPVAAGTDPVESFLLHERSGPPERAATAMTVMLRVLGVPTRVAAGFLPGTRTGPDQVFLVRSRDAHAWVEAWFPTVGWQRFDPTGRAPDAHAEESVLDRLLRFLGRLWPLLLLLAAAAGGRLAWCAARWRRRRAALPWATRFFARVERAGAARGRPRRPQETPVEYANGLAAGVLPDPRLAEVGRLVTAAAWSRHEPAAEDRTGAEKVLREATKAAPAHRVNRLRQRLSRPPGPHGPTIAEP